MVYQPFCLAGSNLKFLSVLNRGGQFTESRGENVSTE